MNDGSHPPQPAAATASSGRAFLVMVDEYFRVANQYFPIYNKDLFLRRMMDAGSAMAEIGSVVESIIECSVHQHRAMHAAHGEATTISPANERANAALQRALASCPQLLFAAPPSPSHLQALTLLATCLLHSPGHEPAGSQLVAAAIRTAQMLGLHRLDDDADDPHSPHTTPHLPSAEHLEQARCFWCLYILDHEISLRTHVPPLLADADLRLADPEVVSTDRCGMIGRRDGEGFINFFAARQRLARIGRAVWAELMRPSPPHPPPPPLPPSSSSSASSSSAWEHRDPVGRIHSRLAVWAQDWFALGGTVALRTRWVPEAIPLIVALQLTYFLLLLRANPDVPGDVRAVERAFVVGAGASGSLSAPRISARVPKVCVDAARDVLRLGTSVPWSAMPHLGDILQTAVPAVLVMLCGCCTDQSGTTNYLDLALADGWVVTIGKLAEVGKDDQLKRVYDVCRRLGSQNPFDTPG